MSSFRYQLEEYRNMASKHKCPACGDRRKTFTYYIDTETKERVGEGVGLCDRVDACGYHLTPREFAQSNGMSRPVDVFKGGRKTLPPLASETIPSFIPFDTFLESLKLYEANAENHLVTFLVGRFGPARVEKLIEKYWIGTMAKPAGATVFWQIDINGLIRHGKVMLYKPSTGKRDKESPGSIGSVSKYFKETVPGWNLVQCLFGEHLLNGNSLPVAIVESEKTAAIASLYLPGFVWLATGGLSQLSVARCQALKGRQVIVYPDLKALSKWEKKAAELRTLPCTVIVSDLLERKATEEERSSGLDLADYLLRFDLSDFNTHGM